MAELPLHDKLLENLNENLVQVFLINELHHFLEEKVCGFDVEAKLDSRLDQGGEHGRAV